METGILPTKTTTLIKEVVNKDFNDLAREHEKKARFEKRLARLKEKNPSLYHKIVSMD